MLRRVGTMMASAVGLGCCPAQATAPDAGYNPINTQMGNYLQIGLPVLGLGLTYLFTSGKVDGASFFGSGFEDGGRGLLEWNRLNGSPRHDFALAFGRMEVVTYGLKYSIDEQRPNGAPHSFPSGHTSASFMGAEFIRKQYGWWAGAPAYVAASYVGWTRQQSRNHYSRDVIAGAVIGILSNHDLSELHTAAGTLDVGFGLLPLDLQPDDGSASGYEFAALGEVSNPRYRSDVVPAFTLHLGF
jgi:hypothetical protein